MVNERRKQEEAVKQDHHTMVGLESMLASLLPTTVDVVLFLESSWSKADVDNALCCWEQIIDETIPTVASSTSCVS
jgi:hypothetical protein